MMDSLKAIFRSSSSKIDPRRPQSICSYCWAELFGPHGPSSHGWLESALATHQSSANYKRERRYSGRSSSNLNRSCRWCKFALEKLDSCNSNSVSIVVTLKISCIDVSSIQEIDVRVATDKRSFSAFCYLYTEHSDPAASFITARPMILDVSSLRAQEEALKCIRKCEQYHEYCSRPIDNPLLPDRVIDCQNPLQPLLVSHNSSTRGQYIALSYVWGEPQPHSTNEHNVKGYHEKIDPTHLPQTIRDAIVTTHAFGVRYLWVDSLCIIQDSPSDKLRQLPQMVRIYSEAYFTIIAASASKASEGFLMPRSLLEDRKADPSFPIWSSSARRLGSFSLGGRPIHTDGDTTPHPILSPDGDPVHSRGWCLQEWFLSPRALVYTSRTLQYHCQARIQNVGSSRYESIRFGNRNERSKFHQLLQTDLKPEDIFVDGLLVGSKAKEYATGILRAWRDILTEYTRRSVTEPSDKLVAFAGVAERFHPLRKSRYYAGLWEDTLLLDLLWTTKPQLDSHVTEYTRRSVTQPSDKLVAFAGVAERFHPLRKSRYYAGLWEDTFLLDLLWTTKPQLGSHVAEYQAPSWSWAAVNSKITIYDTPWPTNSVRQARFQCDVVLADESMPFGQVTSGWLLLHAPVVRVTCRKFWDLESRVDDWDCIDDRDCSDDGFESDLPALRPSSGGEMPDPILCVRSEDLGKDSSAKDDGIASQIYVRLGIARFDQSHYWRLSDLWVVPVMWSTASDASSSKYSDNNIPTVEDLEMLPNYGRKIWAQGLILARLRRRGPDGQTRYRRVGRWFTDFDPDDDDGYIEWAHATWIDKALEASIMVV